MAQSQNRRNTWDGQNGRNVDVRSTDLLHLYIYDYFKRQKYHTAARAFSAELNINTEQPPPIDVSLSDWWSVFWDVYYAKNKEALASKEASTNDEYHDYLRAKKEEAIQQSRNYSLHQNSQRRGSEAQRGSPQEAAPLSSSPSTSPTSLPLHPAMAPPAAHHPTANTPQSMASTLPANHGGRPPTSPSFSPQPPRDLMSQSPHTTAHTNEPMMNSPMTHPALQHPQHPVFRTSNSQYNAILGAAINACGLTGKDQSTWTMDERLAVGAHVRRINLQQPNTMRANPMLMNNPQARMQMQQQQAYIQQQQQQQQAILQQQLQGPSTMTTPQRQEAQLPQQHPMGQSPQVDQRMMGPAVNGQPRQHINPNGAMPGMMGGQMTMGNMQNPNLMNGGFNGDVNFMIAQQMMNKGPMPQGSLTPQQHQAFVQHQQRTAILNRQRLMHQQQYQQQLSMQPTQGAQTPPAGSPNPGQTPTSPVEGKKVNQAVMLYQRQQASHAMQQQAQAQAQAQALTQPLPSAKRQRTEGTPQPTASSPSAQSPHASPGHAHRTPGTPHQIAGRMGWTGDSPQASPGIQFDLERLLMGDTGDFGDMFSGEENAENGQGLLMANETDPFGGGFLASMGGSMELANGQSGLYAELIGHTNKVFTVAFSSDGQWLASGGHDKKVMVWSVQEKKRVYSLEGHLGNITCARWSPDNRQWIATASFDKTLRVWDVAAAGPDMPPKLLVKLEGRAQITAVDFAPDRPDTLCSLDGEGELKVWSLSTSTCEKSLKVSKSSYSQNPMRFHPRTASVLACGVGAQIYIVDITKGGENASRTIHTDHTKNIGAFDWSADGSFLVATSDDRVCVYDTTHWKCVMSQTHPLKVSGCAFVKGGNEKLRIIYGSYEATYIWNCSTPGSQPKKIGSQQGTVANVACCSIAGQTLVASASQHPKDHLMLWSI
ncbi:WD40-repeat-containing domain protein [Sporodiniella umbellata]|nr:WD40-repeat-containing domain protein [Sporodiniella umbellata]